MYQYRESKKGVRYGGWDGEWSFHTSNQQDKNAREEESWWIAQNKTKKADKEQKGLEKH